MVYYEYSKDCWACDFGDHKHTPTYYILTIFFKHDRTCAFFFPPGSGNNYCLVQSVLLAREQSVGYCSFLRQTWKHAICIGGRVRRWLVYSNKPRPEDDLKKIQDLLSQISSADLRRVTYLLDAKNVCEPKETIYSTLKYSTLNCDIYCNILS